MAKLLMKAQKRLRTAIEWLRCPSNTAIRRKIYFKANENLFSGVRIEDMSRMAELVISRPRHERRLFLKAMIQSSDFIYWNDKIAEQIISFLM